MNIDPIFKTALNFEFGELSFAPSYLQAGMIIFLLFVLILTLARLRRMYVNWSLKGATTMLFFGFLLALILEGFLILGGRTLLTEVIGWRNAPKPFLNALDIGRAKLVDVLGVTEEVPASSAEGKASFYDVITGYQSLSSKEAEQFRLMICQP